MKYMLLYAWVALLGLGILFISESMAQTGMMRIMWLIVGAGISLVAMLKIIVLKPAIRHYWAHFMITLFVVYTCLLFTRDLIKGTF